MNQYSHSFILSLRTLRYSQMKGKSIDKSPGEMSVTRVNNHSGLFVEHKHILILIDNVQRDILRKDLQSPPLVRHHKSHHIARTENVVGFDDLVVDSYV